MEPANPPTPDARRLQSELAFVSELANVTASTTEIQPILDWVVEKTVAMLRAEEGSIRVQGSDDPQGGMHTIVRKHVPGFASGSWPGLISMSVQGFLHRAELLATPDLHDDARFPGLRGEATRIRAVLAAPLKVENRIIGMLAVTESKPGRRWSESETQLLSIVASNSARAIEQARLREEARLKREFEARVRQQDEEAQQARVVQMSLVPARPLAAPPWEAVGRIVPARAVGGDAFDYYPLDEGRIGVSIADVSGKGVPAALLMARLVGTLRAFCNGRMPLPEAMARTNQAFTDTAASGKFVTLFYAEVDPARGTVRYVNAGHNPPLLRRASGAIEELAAGGVPIGIMPGWAYEQGESLLGRGDALLLYSDGVTEALDPFGNEYGEERLKAFWRVHGARPPAAAAEALLEDVVAFRGSAEQSDDITVVTIGAAGA
jgi:sigma-B regulation protein RsbU (phosphoserine phosphatase)